MSFTGNSIYILNPYQCLCTACILYGSTYNEKYHIETPETAVTNTASYIGCGI